MNQDEIFAAAERYRIAFARMRQLEVQVYEARKAFNDAEKAFVDSTDDLNRALLWLQKVAAGWKEPATL